MQRNTGEVFYNYQNQDFNTLRSQCLGSGRLFEDPYFKLDRRYEWRRPTQITRNPQLYVSGTAQFDVLQGELGDCWMLASIALLGMYPDLVKKVIPPDQGFAYKYAGIFHFRFWRFGKWFDVVIDDRLPTKRGELVFTKSVSQNEFWTALLEKAYCKILGGEYKVADAGNLCEALEDFTGGITQQYLLETLPQNFQYSLLKAIARRSLVGCFIDDEPGTYQAPTPLGLVRGHSYSVTGGVNINLPQYGNIVLIRVRNPWGSFEWKGPWSDRSPEWRSVPESTKKQLGLVNKDDGEFWMSYSDFVANFQWMDVCHLAPGGFIEAYGKTEIATWQLSSITDRWVRGLTDGGARKIHRNPQIKLILSEADDDNQDGLCSVLIALLQKATASAGDYFEIGFKVYKLHDVNQATLDWNFFQRNRAVASVPLKRVREVADRFNLPLGTYCIVPFTYMSGREGEFLVRIYSEKSASMSNMDATIGLSPDTEENMSPPIKITEGIKDEKVKLKVEDYFEWASGDDKEVDWRELKNVLDFAVKNNVFLPEDEPKGLGNYILNLANSLYKSIAGSSSQKARSSFETIGPGGFSYDLCRSMIALLDIDHSGKLGSDEFQDLWNEIRHLKSTYELHSDKTSGYLNSSGLKKALDAVGFNFNTRILRDIIHRYSSTDGNIPFDDFLHCVIKTKAMAEIFKSKDEHVSNKAEFTFDEFMEKSLYS